MVPTDAEAAAANLLAPGRLFENKYRIISQIGTGSFAEVLKARHEIMGRDVALKCLKPSVVRSTPQVSARFINEVRIVSRLRHPNTVTIFDFGESKEGLAYMVLEYLEGVTLDVFLEQNGPLEQARALHICRQILKSLDEAHAAGIVHRDLKPSNIMLTELHGEADFVKVLDFGVAKLLNEPARQLNKEGPRSTQFIGTPVYMSPEQVLGQSVTPASDIYSLGLLLYQMLSARPPMGHDSVAAVVREHLSPEPLPFKGLERFSPELQRLILKATHRAPGERFQSVGAFMAAMPINPADMSSEGLRILAAAGTFSGETPQLEEELSAPTLAEESSEPDVFSGKNYIELPDPPPDSDAHFSARGLAGRRQRGRTATRRGRSSSAGGSKKRRPSPTPAPTPRADELDLDLEAVARQRARLAHQRRRATPPKGTGPRAQSTARAAGGRSLRGRRRDEQYEAESVFSAPRLSLYLAACLLGYLGFLTLGALLYQETTSVRWVACLAVPAAAIFGSRFSALRAVSGSLSQRWLIPTARNLIIINSLVILLALFMWPALAATGLRTSPTWFIGVFPPAPPFSWVEGISAGVADSLGELFRYVAKALPY